VAQVSPAAPLTARGRRTRETLLRSAEEIFGAKGFESASVVDITQHAGVAQGTFYIYFKDKTACFLELVAELGIKLREATRHATAGLADRVAIERAGLRAFFRFCHEHRNLYRIVRQAEFVDEAVYQAYYRELGETYARSLRAAMDAGQIRRCNPERLAFALMGIADFYGMRWILWERKPDIDKLVDDAMQLIEPMLAVPRTRRPARPMPRRR
jgi:AcrR family transcriptional regulator